MQDSQVPARFPVPFGNAAGAGFIRPIPRLSQIGIQAGSASLDDGFPPVTFTPVGAGGTPPWGQDFNGLLNQISAWCRWVAAGGPAYYDAGFSGSIGGYPKGAVLQSSVIAGRFWVSTAENNTSNPDAGGANWSDILAPFPRGYIDGLILSNDGGSPNTVIDVAAGTCRADTNDWNIPITVATTKAMTAFAPGAGGGGLDTGTGAVANATYAVFAILNTMTGTTDILLSRSQANAFASPSMPSGFTKKRYIGSVLTGPTAALLAFSQFAGEFLLLTTLHQTFTLSGTVGQTPTLGDGTTIGAPLGVKTLARLRVKANGSSDTKYLVSSPDESSQTPVDGVMDLWAPSVFVPTASVTIQIPVNGNLIVRTNTSGQVRVRSDGGGSGVIGVYGWFDERGQNA